MRKKNYKGRCEKQSLEKFTTICKTYDPIQTAYTAKSGTLVFAQKCNTKAGYIDLDIALYLDESKLDKYPDEEFMQDKDIVINSTGNGTLGRVGVYRDTDNPRNLPIVPDSHVTVIRANSSITLCVLMFSPGLLRQSNTSRTKLKGIFRLF